MFAESVSRSQGFAMVWAGTGHVETPEGAVTIDSTWLTANGSAPYSLDTAGETYYLQTDVTTDGAAFTIDADTVTFNLNGYAVTYDNDPITVTNGGFETAGASADLASGWDFANAAAGERYEGVFLDNEIKGGSWSFHLTAGFTGDQYAESSGTITLDANTTYCISGMVNMNGFASGNSAYVKLVRQDEVETITASKTTSNSRGIQLIVASFTTDEVGGTWLIQAGGNNATASGTFEVFVDDVQVQRYQAYGIKGTASTSQDAVITNGTLTQGTGHAYASHALKIEDGGADIVDVTVSVNGPNCSAIFAQYSDDLMIDGNTISSTVTMAASRDAFDAALLWDVGGTIRNNTFSGSPSSAIYMFQNAATINGNTISLKALYTNSFGIVCYSDQGSQVYSNTIDTTQSDDSGRGIFLSRSLVDTNTLTRIYDNTVTVRELSRNQEYNGVILAGSFGIQVEDARDTRVYGNTVHANQTDSDPSPGQGKDGGYAFMFNGGGGLPNVEVYSNTFRGTANGSAGAAAIYIRNHSTSNALSFHDNTLYSNYSWLGRCQNCDDLTLVDCTYRVDGDGTGFRALEFLEGTDSDNYSTGIVFSSSLFYDSLAETLFDAAEALDWYPGYTYAENTTFTVE